MLTPDNIAELAASGAVEEIVELRKLVSDLASALRDIQEGAEQACRCDMVEPCSAHAAIGPHLDIKALLARVARHG